MTKCACEAYLAWRCILSLAGPCAIHMLWEVCVRCDGLLRSPGSPGRVPRDRRGYARLSTSDTPIALRHRFQRQEGGVLPMWFTSENGRPLRVERERPRTSGLAGGSEGALALGLHSGDAGTGHWLSACWFACSRRRRANATSRLCRRHDNRGPCPCPGIAGFLAFPLCGNAARLSS